MSGNNSLVSVLIPAYNHENYVTETIQSIIEQTYKNIEIIVIDDGSSDNTWQKIQEMKDECEKRFIRVVFKTKVNEGTTHTLNQLLAEARGEYVYIIASDDVAKQCAIEKEVEFLDNNSEYALVVGNNEIIDSQSKVCYWDKEQNIVYSKDEASYLTFGEYLQKIRNLNFLSSDFGTYSSLYIGNHVPNGYLIRKNIFEKTGYFTPEAPLEDYYLMLQISKYAKMKYLDEVLFSYRWHSCNSIKNASKMIAYADKTREYEEQILEHITEKNLLKDVYKIKKYGIFDEQRGTSFLYQKLIYRRYKFKVRVTKVLGVEVLKKKTSI